MKGISVIVCCYNSAERLPPTLEHIAAQQASGFDWELIVVDNNSTDATRQVAEAFSNDHPGISIQVVDEKNPGLSFARHRGFTTARYDYALLCDDDNWLAPDYLQTAFDILEREPAIGVVGGVGEAVAPVPLPSWFRSNENSFAVGVLFSTGGYVKYVYGAGMVLRRPAYLKALEHGFTSLLTDRKGKELSSGGDVELCYSFQLMGYKVFQSTSLRFKHFVDKGKLTDDYRERINQGFAKTLLALRPYDLVVSKRTESSGMLWLKEYAYVLKEAALNVVRPREDWDYLESSLRIMFRHRREFQQNVDHIRRFAATHSAS